MIGWENESNFIATRAGEEIGKPDPEIYRLLMYELNVEPEHTLVLEDSSPGIYSAQTAGAWDIAVTTPFTDDGVHQMRGLDRRSIVDEPERVLIDVRDLLSELSVEG